MPIFASAFTLVLSTFFYTQLRTDGLMMPKEPIPAHVSNESDTKIREKEVTFSLHFFSFHHFYLTPS